jgi:hypothetical protein
MNQEAIQELSKRIMEEGIVLHVDGNEGSG